MQPRTDSYKLFCVRDRWSAQDNGTAWDADAERTKLKRLFFDEQDEIDTIWDEEVEQRFFD